MLPWLARGAWALGGWLLAKSATAGGSTIIDGMLKVARFGDFTDQVTVTVVGHPASSKAELFRLAVAAAFGKVSRFSPEFFGLNPAPGMMLVQYNAEEHMVQFIVRYEHTGLMLLSARALGGGATSAVDTMPIFAGPKEDTIGGTSTFSVVGLPTASDKWSGRWILTSSDVVPDPNPAVPAFPFPSIVTTPVPRPPGDYRSRGTLVSMVTNALTNPDGFNYQQWALPADDNKFIGG